MSSKVSYKDPIKYGSKYEDGTLRVPANNYAPTSKELLQAFNNVLKTHLTYEGANITFKFTSGYTVPLAKNTSDNENMLETVLQTIVQFAKLPNWVTLTKADPIVITGANNEVANVQYWWSFDFDLPLFSQYLTKGYWAQVGLHPILDVESSDADNDPEENIHPGASADGKHDQHGDPEEVPKDVIEALKKEINKAKQAADEKTESITSKYPDSVAWQARQAGVPWYDPHDKMYYITVKMPKGEPLDEVLIPPEAGDTEAAENYVKQKQKLLDDGLEEGGRQLLTYYGKPPDKKTTVTSLGDLEQTNLEWAGPHLPGKEQDHWRLDTLNKKVVVRVAVSKTNFDGIGVEVTGPNIPAHTSRTMSFYAYGFTTGGKKSALMSKYAGKVGLLEECGQLRSILRHYADAIISSEADVGDLDLTYESAEVGKFADAIEWLMEKNHADGGALSPRNLLEARESAFTMGLDDKWRPTYVRIQFKPIWTTGGAPGIDPHAVKDANLYKGFEEFKKRGAIDSARTLHYIFHAEEILKEGTELDWSDFVKKYTNPIPEIRIKPGGPLTDLAVQVLDYGLPPKNPWTVAGTETYTQKYKPKLANWQIKRTTRLVMLFLKKAFYLNAAKKYKALIKSGLKF